MFIGIYCDAAQYAGSTGVELMPSDVSLDVLTHAVTAPSRRFPLGVGLALGACASLALWTFVGLGLRALFS